MPTDVLPVLFFFVAVLYASVGLGGGSSYTALMAIAGLDYRLIPTTSLTLNLLVTLVGMATFWRGGHVKWRLIWPFLVTSIPLAYLGGAVVLSRDVFLWLLLLTLAAVAARIYLWPVLAVSLRLAGRARLLVALLLGAALGFIAGAVGIGGGIFLVPIMILLGLAPEKDAAGTGAVFIWVNSLAGIISRSQRGTFDTGIILPLAAAVIVGGLIGSSLVAFRVAPRTVQTVIGIIVIIAIGFIGRRLV